MGVSSSGGGISTKVGRIQTGSVVSNLGFVGGGWSIARTDRSGNELCEMRLNCDTYDIFHSDVTWNVR